MTIINENACTFADTARHIRRGEGFSTGIVWPLALSYSEKIDPSPDLYNPPLYSLVLAIFFIIFGMGDGTILLCTTLLYLATIALTFYFAREIFGLSVAILTGFLFALNRFSAAQVLHGDETMLLTFLVTATLYVFYKKGLKDIKGSAATGALLGLCALTSYPLGLLLIPLLGYGVFAGGKDRGRRAVAIVGGFLAVTVIWFIRNTVVSGNPLISLSWTTIRYGPISPSMMADTLRDSEMFNLQWTRFRYEPLTLFGIFLLPFFVVAALYRIGNREFEQTKVLVYLFLFFVLAVQGTVKDLEPMLLLPFLPFVLLTACGYVFNAIDTYGFRRPVRKYGIIFTFVILNLFDSIPYLNLKSEVARIKQLRILPNYYYKTEMEVALSLLPGDAIIMNALPRFMAWYNDRRTMPLTTSMEDYKKVKKIFGNRLAVYINADIMQDEEVPGAWEDIIEAVKQGYNPKALAFSKGVGFQDRFDILFYDREVKPLGTGQ